MKYLRNLPEGNARPLADLISARPGQVVSMALTRQENWQMILLAVSEGESISDESYPGDTMYYILEGTMLLETAEGIRTVKEGECLAVPADTLHAIRGEGAFKVLQVMLS